MKERLVSPEALAKENISTRGATFQGVVVSTKAAKMAVVERQFTTKVRKYERFEKRNTKIHAHVVDGFPVKDGDIVEVAECRKISKTKSHVVTKVIGSKLITGEE